MRRFYLAIGVSCLVLAAVFVLYAWYEIWWVHRREVERIRTMLGPDLPTPAFSPLSLVNWSEMPMNSSAAYVFALAFGVSGLLSLILWRMRR